MTQTTLALLDQAELFQLATNASSSDDDATAIGYLKEAVSRPDATAKAHYLLGALYAQIKLYDRAADEMEAAIALDPALSAARLQLGLLWLTGNVADRAEATLTPLMELSPADPMHHFGRGLVDLLHDRLEQAVGALEQGIALNTVNAPLNGDMRRIIDGVAALRAQAPQAAPEAPAADSDGAQHVLLSAYTGNTSH